MLCLFLFNYSILFVCSQFILIDLDVFYHIYFLWHFLLLRHFFLTVVILAAINLLY